MTSADDASKKKKKLRKPQRSPKEEKSDSETEEPGPSSKTRQRQTSRYLKAYERRTALAEQLVYFDAPKFIQPLRDTEARPGATVTLAVEVEGTPPPRVMFYKNGEIISAEQRYIIQHPEEAVWTLTISNVTESDDAEYACCAHSVVGEAWCYADLYVVPEGLFYYVASLFLFFNDCNFNFTNCSLIFILADIDLSDCVYFVFLASVFSQSLGSGPCHHSLDAWQRNSLFLGS